MAQNTIDKGLQWNIGNGRKVNIWKDRWLPTPDSVKVVSPRSHDSELEMVGNLLDLDRGSWDIEKVRCTFLHHEIKAILGIPINPDLPEDSKSWLGQKMANSRLGALTGWPSKS